MSSVLHSFTATVNAAYTGGHGQKFAKAFDLSENVDALGAQIRRLPNIENFSRQNFDEEIAILADHHFSAILAGMERSYDKTFTNLEQMAQYALKLSNESSFFIELLRQVLSDARHAAGMAGEHYMHEAVRLFQKVFGKCITDRSTDGESFRQILLFVTNGLFRLYFGMNSINLSSNLLKNFYNTPGSTDIDSLDESAAQKVTFRYYEGQLLGFEESYERAEQCMVYAYRNCPPLHARNKRLIFLQLVCFRMLRGCIPDDDLLDRRDLGKFKGLSSAIRMGSVRKFRKTVTENELFFIRRGIYFLVQRMAQVVYRNFVKRVMNLINGTKLRYEQLRIAFSVDGISMDNTEVECIIANLISKGYVKAYISHKHETVVFSKGEPFPMIKLS